MKPTRTPSSQDAEGEAGTTKSNSPNTDAEGEKEQTDNSVMIIIIAVVILCILGIGAYIYSKKTKKRLKQAQLEMRAVNVVTPKSEMESDENHKHIKDPKQNDSSASNNEGDMGNSTGFMKVSSVSISPSQIYGEGYRHHKCTEDMYIEHDKDEHDGNISTPQTPNFVTTNNDPTNINAQDDSNEEADDLYLDAGDTVNGNTKRGYDDKETLNGDV